MNPLTAERGGALTNHESLLQASAGYREFAARAVDVEGEDCAMLEEFADWFLVTAEEATDYSERTADKWTEEYEAWSW